MKKFLAEANGRVNLIGEHTDYNGGWVLPTAIPQKVRAELLPRTDQKVIVSTQLSDKISTLNYSLGKEEKTNSWIDYIQGTTQILRKVGPPFSGFELQLTSSLPTGSGLSSSAALLIGVLRVLRDAFTLSFDDLTMARLAQKIENEFVGAKVGIMDQMACTFAKPGQALFLDTKTLEFAQLNLPMDQMDLVVINSGVEHQHAGGDYNQRRAECERACAELGVSELRELGEEDLPRLEVLPDVLRRRARHVITENARVHRAVAALKKADLPALGKLFYESHASMRDDYQVSIPAIDSLVEICASHPATFGARMTGGGFGGSIVAVTKKNQGAGMAAECARRYQEKNSHRPSILVPAL